jgi:hypothetical protein
MIKYLIFGVIFIFLFFLVSPSGNDREVGPVFGVEKVSEAIGEIRRAISVT